MSLNVKALMAALAFGVATHAGAALTTGAAGNGGLALIVWDDSATVQKSYTQSLGIGLDAFIGGGGTSQSFALDPLFATVFASSTPGNLNWNIVAADSISGTGVDPKRILSTQRTAAGAPGAVKNGALSNAANLIDGFYSTLNSFTANAPLTSPANCGGAATSCYTNKADFSSLSGSGYGGNNWGNNFSGLIAGIDNAGQGAGDTLGFWLFAQTPKANPNLIVSNNTDATQTELAGHWSLNAANHSLLYTVAAVPEPSSYVMLLAGVGLLGFIARRRMSL